MNTLLVLRDSDVESGLARPHTYRDRTAVRAVIFNRARHVALMHSIVKQYHKLPGGGVEDGESFLDALQREVLEETGCMIDDITELGMVEEFRNGVSLHQLSYCYTAQLVGEPGTPSLTDDEVLEGFVPVWLSLPDAIATLESELGSDVYLARFMTRRDLAFLKAAYGTHGA